MSLGGGAFINETIRRAINKNGLSIWLNTDIKIINSRIKNTKNIRPLLKKFDTIDKLENLMTERGADFFKRVDQGTLTPAPSRRGRAPCRRRLSRSFIHSQLLYLQ